MTRSSSSRAHWRAELGIQLAIAACAVAVVWTFAAFTLRRADEFGLPLEDGYIYLTYAKQFGRGELFTYYPGGGYSAGSTSPLWPMLVAPFWTLGARGHALVWVSFGLCGALYTATCVGCYRVVRTIAGSWMGVICALLVLLIAPFAWTCLSGMEVAFASALLVGTILLMLREPAVGAPSKVLGVCLATTALARPEAMLLVFAICGVSCVIRARRRDYSAAAWWLAPLAAPIAWLVANKLFAGHAMPNTGVAKSYFYLPGFDWTFWWDALTSQLAKAASTMFWGTTGPLVWGGAVTIGWIVGSVRVMRWAIRADRTLAGLVIVTAPLALIGGVIASSGNWEFHNYRYSAPAFPLIMIAVAIAMSPARRVSDAGYSQFHLGWHLVASGITAVFAYAAIPRYGAELDLYAQDVVDLNTQVVALGRYIHDHLPDARILYHDAGAIAYYGDRPVYDMLGLVTNHQADVANNGPGSRFEFLESLPADERPTHIAYYPSWMGQAEFYGPVVMRTPLARQFASRRLIGGDDMQLIEAVFDHVHTAERPLSPQVFGVVDRLDIADVVSEKDHAWTGELGRRKFDDRTAHWSVFEREVGDSGIVLDGGRTIRGGETFTMHVKPDKLIRLVLRTGGQAAYAFNETIAKPVTLTIEDDAGNVRTLEIPPPRGTFVELAVDLPGHYGDTLTLRTRGGIYRAFHWFVLQP